VPDVTAVLLNWKRPKNVRRIIRRLQEQTHQPEILLIDHSIEGYPWDVPGRLIRIPWDTGPFVRVLFSPYARTSWIMHLGDDLMPRDSEFVADLRRIAELRHDGLVGAFGKRLAGPPRYYSTMPDVEGWVHTVKRCYMFHRSKLERTTLRYAAQYPPLHDDLYLSLEIARGRMTNWVEPGLRKRLVELPAPHAISARPSHYAERDRVVAWHLGKFELDDLLNRAEDIPALCTRRELAHLWECAMAAPALPIVEMGVFQGSSAVVLADVAYRKQVPLILIDRFEYGTPQHGQSSAELVRANLIRAGARVRLRIVDGDSRIVPGGIDKVGFLHVDTDHRAEHWNAEMDVWLPHMAPGSVLAFHDYGTNSPEMAPAIDGRIGTDPAWRLLGLVRWMICFQKEGADAS